MAVTTQTHPLPFGCKLVFHFDDAYPQEEQVGVLSYYVDFINLLAKDSLEYYNLSDGTNKFLRHVTLHIWADQIPYDTSPDNQPYEQTFWTTNEGDTSSHIYAHWLDPAVGNDYRFPASLSHEFGHAYSFWCGWPQNSSWGTVISELWSKQVVGAQDYPQGWNRFEAFANAFRCLKGHPCTRGVSGSLHGGSDPVPSPMQDPLNHPEWLKQFNLQGELSAFMASYGCQQNTLVWQGDATGYWQFRRTDGVWVAQTDYYSWFQWVNLNGTWQWQQYYPTYNRI